MRLARGEYLLTVHAFQRQQERAILDADIRSCGKTARNIYWQNEQDSWRLDGNDIDGFPLSIIAVEEQDLLIITMFRPQSLRKKK